MNPLIILIIVMIACLFVIMKSAGYAITAISNYAKTTGISDYLLGFIIVSIGTSLPEISTAIFASLSDKGALILGDVIGANIIDATIVLGMMAIVARKIKIKDKMIGKTKIMNIALLLVPLFLGFDGVFSRFDGIILLLFFSLHIFMLARGEKKSSKIKKSIKFKAVWKDIAVFSFAIIALLVASRWLVESASIISETLNIPLFMVGIFLVAFGTTIPELTIEIKAALAKRTGIGFGDIFGSIITNILLVLGLASIIRPIIFDAHRFMFTSIFMLAAVTIATGFISRKEINWKHGIILLFFYGAFAGFEIFIL